MKVKNKWYDGLVNHIAPLASSSRDDVLDYIYRTDLVNWYTTYLLRKRIDDELVREYVQEIWVQLSEVSPEKWKDLYEQGKAAITAFASTIIHNNCISVNSKAYYHIKKPSLKEVHFTDSQWMDFDENGKIPAFINFNSFDDYEYQENQNTENRPISSGDPDGYDSS